MSNIRLFFEESLSLNLKSQLNRSQSHYLSKVMRLGNGQKFSLFNESGEWVAKVDDINKGIVEFTIQKKLRSAENDKEIWLAFTPIKLNYLNLMIQKATELGITRFIPILTERTVVRKLNEKRINKIIAEASEQSNRLNIPKLEKITKLENKIAKLQQPPESNYRQHRDIKFPWESHEKPEWFPKKHKKNQPHHQKPKRKKPPNHQKQKRNFLTFIFNQKYKNKNENKEEVMQKFGVLLQPENLCV